MSVRERIRKIKHLQNKHFICVLENPTDIANIASAFRNISAFGVTKLYVINGLNMVKDFETSRSNKKLTNVSVGANKWVFVRYFPTSKECISHLSKNGYISIATSSHKKGIKNTILYEGSFTQKKLAVWFGNESKGLSSDALINANVCVQIPMGGIVESLNLGTSTGIVLGFIGYQRLKFLFDKNKVKFKSKGEGKTLMESWEKFIGGK